MSNKKRTYKSENRQAQALQTRANILKAAKKLFKTKGFELATIEEVAETAGVSAPTIYSLFKSKRGLLRTLMDEAFPAEQFQALVEEVHKEKSPKKRLATAAKIARNLYDSEKKQVAFFGSAAVLAPEFKKLEKEREERRYHRQEGSIEYIAKEKSLKQELSTQKARDLLWLFTGRDIYRMLVDERGWSPEEYEQWLAEQLSTILLKQ